MTNKISISVIIPFYKAGKFAERLVNCLVSQSSNTFEVIFVDDGEGEGILELKAELNRQSARFKYIVLATSGKLGPGAARNMGLEHALGRYIAFLDSDDLWPNQYLERALHEFDNGDYALLAFSSCYLNENYDMVNQSLLPTKISFKHILQTCPISLPGVVLDRNKIGDFRFNERGHEDYQLWLMLLSSGHEFQCINDLPVYITRVQNSFSANKIKAVQWQWLALRDYSGSSLVTRSIFMVVYFINAVLKRKQKKYRPKYLPQIIINLLV